MSYDETFAKVFNIQRYSLYDGPGIRTTVFFSGCPLKCVWCHNPEGKTKESVISFAKSECTLCGACSDACPTHAHKLSQRAHEIDRALCIGCSACENACSSEALKLLGKRMTISEIICEVMRDADFYSDGGGLTVSGGEPFMQLSALVALLSLAKENGISTAVETSGFTSREALGRAAEYTDIFLYDIKHTNPERHKIYTGVDNRKILENLSFLDSISARVILRCPIIPEVNNTREHFEAVAALAEKHTSVESVELMPYHSLWHEKAEKIGQKIEYTRSEPENSTLMEKYAEIFKLNTKKPIRVNKSL